MSTDGISKKSLPPVLRLAATNSNAANADTNARRAPADDARLAGGSRTVDAVTEPAAEPEISSQSARRYPRFVPSAVVTQVVLDLLLISETQAIVLFLIYSRLGLESLTQAAVVIGFSVLTVTLFFYATGCYRRDALLSGSIAMSRVPIALGFSALLLLLALHYAFPYLYPASRVYLSVSRDITIILIGTSISLGAALVSRAIVRSMLNQNLFRRRILVIGTGKRARYIQELNESPSHGMLQEIHYASEAILKDSTAPARPADADVTRDPLSISAIDELSSRLDIDEVVLALDDRRGVVLDGLVECKAQGFPVTDFNSFIERMTGRIDLAWLEISWLLHTAGFQMRMLDGIVKRAIDIVLSAVALLISLPVLIVAMVAIKLDSAGPIFYRQKRVTLNGRTFWLFKLRTMRPDAESDGPQWADENDPRVTKVGAFLRRTRLDEIPQLLNILWGDMSIVGPRPERPMFVDQLSGQLRLYKLRHSVRAGLTGWAQINYRYGASMEDSQRKLEYDLFYIKNFSLLRDGAIMLQTLRVLLWPDGVR